MRVRGVARTRTLQFRGESRNLPLRDAANRHGSRARFSSDMSNYEDPHPKKKVTAATTDAPQEEFIEPENIPSKVERTTEEKPDARKSGEPPRR